MDLREDQRVGRVGHSAVDLDTAVDRPRVHHLLAGPDPLGRDSPARGVLAQARHVGRLHPLLLHPEDVDDVRRLDRADVGGGLAAERLDPARQERRRPDEGRVRADERERLDQRASDAAVQDVADDRHVQPLERSERLAHREEVEQRLGRVLVLAVAGVDDRGARVAGDELRRADLRVADDDRVRLVRRQRQHGVLERLALVERRAGRLQRHHVRDSLFAASSKLDEVRVEDSKKSVRTSLPRSVGSFSSTPASAPRGLEDPLDVVAGQVGDRDQMLHLCLLRCGDEQDPVDAVDLLELHLDPLAAGRRQVLADVVGPDRQLAMAAVDEDGELDTRRPAVLEERLDRGANRAARVEDVVDEHARHPRRSKSSVGRVHDRLLLAGPRSLCRRGGR